MLSDVRKFRRLMLGGALVAALALAGCGDDNESSGSNGGGGDEAAAVDAGNKVGYISFAPVTASQWERSNWGAVEKAAEKHGLEVSNQEGVAFDEAGAVLSRMAQEQHLIIANSSGYEAAILEVAPRFPDTMFVMFDALSTTKGLENVAGWGADWNQLGYMGGAAGCLAAKDKGADAVGLVIAQPIPALTHFAGGVKQGTEAEGCRFMITWTNSFTDTAAGKQAALAMIGKGAGAIMSLSDAGDDGAKVASNEKGVPFVANYAPTDGALTSLVIHFDEAYDDIASLWKEQKIKPDVYPLNVQNGLLSYATPFEGASPSVEKAALEIQEKIKSGEIEVDPALEVKP